MKELRLISLPNIIRNSENNSLVVESSEVLLSSMLLSNKFGGVSAITLGLLEQRYKLNRDNIKSFIDLIPAISEKGLLQIKTNNDKIGKNTLIEVLENIQVDEGQYTTIDFNLIEKILLTDKRIDTKAIAIHTLLILQSRAGYRDMKSNNSQKGYCYPSIIGLAKDVGVAKQTIENSLNLLAELDIIEIINQGYYVTTNKEGKETVKSFPNAYIIKQITYTERDILSIKADIGAGLQQVEDKAEEDKLFSILLDYKTGGDYNKNREIDFEDIEQDLENFEKAKQEEWEQNRPIVEKPSNYKVSKEEDLARDDNGDLIVF